MKDCIVSISEPAFFNIVTSALEAYKLEHSVRGGGSDFCVETFGHLWGYETQSSLGFINVYKIVWADTSTAVERDRDSVLPKDEAYELKESFISNFFPDLTYLGDFHSHPYDSAQDEIKSEHDLEKAGLYKFSKADFSSVKHLQETGVNYRVGLVVTVYESDSKKPSQAKKLDDETCIRFQYDNTIIWIKSYVWTSNSELQYRRKADRMVKLLCPTLGFNAHN